MKRAALHSATLCSLLSISALTANAAAGPSLEEVVVTGTRNLLGESLLIDHRTETASRNTQVSLNRTVGDWMEQLPGVSLNGQGGLLQSYSVRGSSRWRIRTEVMGVPIFTDRRAGNAASFIPPALLGQVAVSRGPGSTLYGTDAMGGVVNLTLTPTEQAGVAIDGRDNDQAIGLSLGGPIRSGVGGALALRRAGNAKDGAGNTLNTEYEQAAGFIDAQASLGPLETQLTVLASSGRDIGKSNRGFPDDLRADYPDEQHGLVRLEVRDPGRWLGRLYAHQQDWSNLTVRADGRRNDTRYRSDTLGGLLYHQLDLGPGMGRMGLEWLGRRNVDINDREVQASDGAVLERQVLSGSQDNLGLFLDQQWALGNWRLGAGVRWDHIEQTGNGLRRSDHTANATLSADWHIDERWTVESRFGTGFRFPTLSERYLDGVTPRGDTLGNPDLAPERNTGVELGVKMETAQFSGSISAYHNRLDDYIERLRLGPQLRSFRNLDTATIEGIEATLNWRPSNHWQHRMSYQWQQGEDTAGNWLADLHPVEWRYLARWRHAELGVSLDVTHRESRANTGPGETPLAAATLASVSLDWVIGPAWQLSLSANNGFDTRWVASADEEAAFQPGRTIGLRLVWQGG